MGIERRAEDSPGSGPATRLGAVAFIHRFGSSLNAHLHFHCVVIDGVFDAATTGGIIFRAATELEANAIADVQACVRRRLLRVVVRRGLLPRDDARAMGQWAHGGGFSVDGSVRIEAEDRAGRERRLRYCARPPSRRHPAGSATTCVPSGPLPPKIDASPALSAPPNSGSCG